MVDGDSLTNNKSKPEPSFLVDTYGSNGLASFSVRTGTGVFDDNYKGALGVGQAHGRRFPSRFLGVLDQVYEQLSDLIRSIRSDLR